MHIELPAAMDIFLTGGKTHPSETRLCQFLIQNLNRGDIFIDVGAHYGFFTLLASQLVGPLGKVFSFEPSSGSFRILSLNTENESNIKAFNLAVGDRHNDLVTFYQYPAWLSEYSSLTSSQYPKYGKFGTPIPVDIKMITCDAFFREYHLKPNLIKIDVEGAELSVLKGLDEHLTQLSLTVVMEYLHSESQIYREALKFMQHKGYEAFIIENNGNLKWIQSIEDFFNTNKLTSDNIVFKKPG